MEKIYELATHVRELEEQLVVCIKCGMCQAVCPLFEQTKKESDVARGKLTLLEGLMNRMFSGSEGVSERLNHCLLCGSCAAHCPAGVDVVEIFIKARAILAAYEGLPMTKKLVFRRMLAKPVFFNRLFSVAEKFQKTIIKEQESPQNTSCSRFRFPVIAERHFMSLAKTPFHRSKPALQSPADTNSPRVLMFTGCLIDKIMPSIAHATVKALAFHGVSIQVPEPQGCCGIPALASGDMKTFNSLVSHHIRLFCDLEFDYILSGCASCTATIKELWPTMYKGAPEEHDFLKALSAKTMDINQYLVDILSVTDENNTLSEKEAVTYHDPCHLKKSLNVSSQPRTLIRAAGHSLVEMEKADQCCGMGGSFNLFHYDLSCRIGSLKRDGIADTKCQLVASGCPACIMQISDMLSKAGDMVKVCHPVELYASRLDGSET